MDLKRKQKSGISCWKANRSEKEEVASSKRTAEEVKVSLRNSCWRSKEAKAHERMHFKEARRQAKKSSCLKKIRWRQAKHFQKKINELTISVQKLQAIIKSLLKKSSLEFQFNCTFYSFSKYSNGLGSYSESLTSRLADLAGYERYSEQD